MTKANVLITGHRGMGVTAKPSKFRGDLLEGAVNFPENSIAAFTMALYFGAEALECDIVVSSDGVPMVIHADTLGDYAHLKSVASVRSADEVPKIRNVGCYTKEELKRDFVLKSISSSEWEDSDTIRALFMEEGFSKEDMDDLERNLVLIFNQNKSQNKSQNKRLAAEESRFLKEKIAVKLIEKRMGKEKYSGYYTIPTLHELLFLVSSFNAELVPRGMKPIILNIELKGAGSAIATLKALVAFNQDAPRLGYSPIHPETIVLLGRVEGEKAEIVIAKNFLKEAPGVMFNMLTSNNLSERDEKVKMEDIAIELNQYRVKLEEKRQKHTKAKREFQDCIKRLELDAHEKEGPVYDKLRSLNADRNAEIEKLGNAKAKEKNLIIKKARDIANDWLELLLDNLPSNERELYHQLKKASESAEQELRNYAKLYEDFLKVVDPSFDQLHGGAEITEFFETIIPGNIGDIAAEVDVNGDASTKDLLEKIAIFEQRLKTLEVELEQRKKLLSEIESSGQNRDEDTERQIKKEIKGLAWETEGIYETLRVLYAPLIPRVKELKAMKAIKVPKEQKKSIGKLTGVKFSKKPQGLSAGNIKNQISGECFNKSKLSEAEKSAIMFDFLQGVCMLKGVRTNFLVTTAQMFGQEQMERGSIDFDVIPNARPVDHGMTLISRIFDLGYNGIDISLFDADEMIISRIKEGLAQARQRDPNFSPILGFTAATWKGIESESEHTFGQAFVRAMAIAEKSTIDILLKVDEPGYFRALKELCLYVYQNPEARRGESFLKMRDVVVGPEEIEEELNYTPPIKRTGKDEFDPEVRIHRDKIDRARSMNLEVKLSLDSPRTLLHSFRTCWPKEVHPELKPSRGRHKSLPNW